MNIFDAAIWAFVALAIIMGFNSGLLRSLATILGYVIAAPFALGVAPALSRFLAQTMNLPPSYNGVVLAFNLIVAGILMGALLRRAIGDVTGPQVGLLDRITGALLGAGRVALMAVLIVVIFDRIIPPGRQPAFLAQSQLYPYLSTAGKAGMQALPRDVIDYIDRLKKERGL